MKCLECGIEIGQKRYKPKYCSNVCRGMAYSKSKMVQLTCECCGNIFERLPCTLAKPGKGRFCSATCHYNHGIPLDERFFNYIGEKQASGCILWAGSVGSHGYGQIYRDGQPSTASRVSYELCVGPIPEGLFVLHRCDNRPCINPVHLFVGTQSDNMQDMLAKGRGNNGGWRKKVRTFLKG